MFAIDLMGNKHYYYRFYNENGIELYTLEKKREFFQTVFIPCEGFMVGIDQRHRLEEILKWLPTLEHGTRGEIERVFNESMDDPKRWADLGFANLLGRYDEAKAHNSPILEERRQRDEQRKAEREAERRQREQERQASYYTERLICEILMALEQNAVNMGMEYDDCQKAMGGDLSKAAKKEWYLRHKDRGIEP